MEGDTNTLYDNTPELFSSVAAHVYAEHARIIGEFKAHEIDQDTAYVRMVHNYKDNKDQLEARDAVPLMENFLAFGIEHDISREAADEAGWFPINHPHTNQTPSIWKKFLNSL